MNISKFVELGKKIVCVGRNYAEHATELGNKVPTEPLLFLKPTTAYLSEGNKIKMPPGCTDLHHEVELGVVIGTKGTDIPVESAMDHVGGYALALDMTARNLQDAAKKKGHPWTLAKAFDTSCPVSKFVEKERVQNVHNVRLWLSVNGDIRQDGNTSDMIFKVPTLISYISRSMTLEPGDMILTGTPSGVGPVKSGDVIVAGLDQLMEMSFSVAE
ncbi:acylpyruvase FAHD1, mitochondrial-like [Anneissia japonica]|uniref:acylpyruvase FAHD1, mitochondrial-like n=1 Tax=Anneissia japonica TaxID=1529436 RepID=UPI00142592E7|nr:acylpyruvase FAHD1, mitochondrial-like [Anneissia japonica]